MPKGSQLSQLKSALSHAGVTKPQQGSKRKRSKKEDVDKERRAAKLREIQQKMNLFDVQVTKVKHGVGGRKIKGAVGRPAQSKQAGIQQRTKTLLKEHQDKDRSGGIFDRRFGENDPTMTPEERMLERFTRERQRESKGAWFNLEEEDELTHYGQSLSKLDDYDNIGLGLDNGDEEDAGQIDSRTVQKVHFGGFESDEDDDEEGPERKKTKPEVMAEVIAKSKEHKYLRQMQQEKDEDLRHQLDQDLESMRSLLYTVDTERPADEAKLNAAVEAPNVQDREYDKAVRELAFEQRAKPKDRTKTEEELALEEKQALERAERKRQRRMQGEDTDSESENGRRKRLRQIGGDDLEDDFYGEDGFGPGLQEQADEPDEGEDGGSGGEGEDGEEGLEGEDEEEDSEEDGADAESEAEDSGSAEGDDNELVQKRKGKTGKPNAGKELPYTFPCPESYEEFLDILEDVEGEDVPTVVHRIRTFHHPSLAEDNKFKLQRLTGVLIDYILHIMTPPSPRFNLLSALIPHLFALSKTYPTAAAQHFVEKLVLMQKNLRLGLSRGATKPDVKTWPSLPELMLLRTAGLIWSASDLNHPVIGPARLLMASYLGLCRVRDLCDICSGLFICTLWLQFEDYSKRFVPEVVTFLANTLLHLSPHKITDVASLPGSFPSPDFGMRSELRLDTREARKLSFGTADLPAILLGTRDEQMKVDLLGTCLALLERFADQYKSLDGFLELYSPVQFIFAQLDMNRLPGMLRDRVATISSVLSKLLKFSKQQRVPLSLQMHKPIPIPSYVPKFEERSSNYLRNRDPDHERNEAAKLRRQVKQEKKGAIRELRKDARFLAAVKQKEQQEKDRVYNERLKKAHTSIEPERAEEKAMLREKAKEKRRAGRR
ncbi:Nop14-like protein [Thelephora ganbajun]|uniref:Nop14-like protein n=1 Tax=Thelephora ganbajun TaxID=370292 RepID=A0ACB6ZPX2_THEGA|nr:Nop14-like protein [Thelephora ganbajun]